METVNQPIDVGLPILVFDHERNPVGIRGDNRCYFFCQSESPSGETVWHAVPERDVYLAPFAKGTWHEAVPHILAEELQDVISENRSLGRCFVFELDDPEPENDSLWPVIITDL